MLAESLNVSWWLPWLIFLLIQIPLLYSISETARYYIRMILYGFTIIIGCTCAIPFSIPSYFLNKVRKISVKLSKMIILGWTLGILRL